MTPASDVQAESANQLNALVMAVSHGVDAMPMVSFLCYGKRRLVLGFVRNDEWGQGWEWLGDYTRRVGADAVVLTTDAFIREQGSDELFPYVEGGAPRDDPKAGEAILSWGLAYRDRGVHVDCSILLPYHRNDEGGIDWDAQVTEAGSVAGEVPTEIAQGLMAPRGDDLAGVVLDARKAGHVIVLVDGKPWHGPR